MSAKLDLKYRPQKFAEVLGNEGVKQLLLVRSKKGEFTNQSMMFSGPKGCGKTSLARLVARSIVCTARVEGEPCNECMACKSVLEETSTSVEELDAASQGTVDKIRSMVRDIEYEPLDGAETSIYIVDEAQRLSKAAQDAFLRAIENRQFIVIFCTTEPHKIQGPIRDRLEEYPIRPPTEDELVHRMTEICQKEQIQASDEVLHLIAQIHGNTPRSSFLAIDSLSDLGEITVENAKKLFRFDSYKLTDLVLTLVDSDPVKAFEYLDMLSNLESSTWIRDAIVLAVSSAFRESIGAKSTYLVPTHFFSIRQRNWIKLAQKIGGIDRPSIADIEAALLVDSQAVPESEFNTELFSNPKMSSAKSVDGQALEVEMTTVSESADHPLRNSLSELQEARTENLSNYMNKPVLNLPPIESTSTEPKSKEAKPVKSIEVEGVRFSSTESLTSLDDKIEKSELKKDIKRDLLEVELDKSRVPVTSKEFSKLLKDI